MFHVVTAGPLLARGRRGASPACCSRAISRWCRTARATGWSASRASPAASCSTSPASRSASATRSSATAAAARPRRSSAASVRFDHPAAQQLIRLLPRLISVEAWSSPEMEWIQSTLRFMAAEARELRARRRDGHHAPGRHPGDPGHPLLDRAGPGRADRVAGRAARPADRPRHRADPPRPGARLDGGLAGGRGRDVALGVRRALHASWSASRPCTTSRAGRCTPR